MYNDDIVVLVMMIEERGREANLSTDMGDMWKHVILGHVKEFNTPHDRLT